MATGIVHDLEVIKIEIQQRMLPLALLLAGLQRGHTPFELPPVNKTGQRVMGGLVSHLRCHFLRMRNIMEYQHGAYEMALLIPYRRSRVFNRKSVAVSLYQKRMQRQARRLLFLKNPLNWIGGRLIGL